MYLYNLLALDASLSTKFFVTQFLLGLKDELRASVCIQAPNSITQATVFARIQEEELDQQRPRYRITNPGRPPPTVPVPAALGKPPPPVPPAVPAPHVAPVPRPASIDDSGRER